jgi:uncharacterized membrane protein
LALASANPRAFDEANPALPEVAMHVLAHVNAHSRAHPRGHARPLPVWAWVAGGGIALGFADLAFAALYWSLHSDFPPIRIAQGIAGWVLGTQEARAGGIATALAGLALYAAIVAAMVAGYMRLARHWPRLHAHAWSAGTAYGLAMYVLLFDIVLPNFSAATLPTHAPLSWTVACLAAYAGIGLGCAAIARASSAAR